MRLDDTHPSLLLMVSIILVMAIALGGLFFSFVPSYIGKIVAEAGNVTRVNFSVTQSAAQWDGVYGSLTLSVGPLNYTGSGGNVSELNLTVIDLGAFLDPTVIVFASEQSFLNASALIPANQSDVDNYLNVSASTTMSGTMTFTSTANFFVGGVNHTLNSTTTNSPVQGFDLGIMIDNNTGALFFLTHIKPGGTSFNSNPADFQLMLPIPEGQTPTFNLYIGELGQCSVTIPLYQGINWMSMPCTLADDNITVALESLGVGAGSNHDTFAGWPGCTGNATDNFAGNYTVVWTYNASDFADPWKDYNPNKPCFQISTEKIQRLTTTENFQITINVSTESMASAGDIPVFTSIPLVSGINWIGYPSTSIQYVNDVMDELGDGEGCCHGIFVGWPGCTGNPADNFAGNYTVVWTYNASDFADPWKDYNPDKPCFQISSEKLLYMVPGAGYQVTINVSNETLTITN